MGNGGNPVDEDGNHLVLVVDLVMYAVELLRYQHLHMALPLRHDRYLTVYITQLPPRRLPSAPQSDSLRIGKIK